MAGQRTPSSPATTTVPFSFFVLLRISPSKSACAALSVALSIAGPIAIANFCCSASASNCLKNATACSLVNPLVYSGNGCVAMRMVCTWYPRDSKVVCARRSIFSASVICCWYCARSRLMNAVIARIFGLAGFGAAFPCASAEPAHAVAARSASARKERNRNAVRSRMENLPYSTIVLLPALPGSRFYKLTRFGAPTFGWLKSSRRNPLVRSLHKGGDAGDALADHQLVNVVGTFVGGHALEIVH